MYGNKPRFVWTIEFVIVRLWFPPQLVTRVRSSGWKLGELCTYGAIDEIVTPLARTHKKSVQDPGEDCVVQMDGGICNDCERKMRNFSERWCVAAMGTSMLATFFLFTAVIV